MVSTVGTLSYTAKGIVVLFFWLLCGDFCLTLVEAIVPYILPLELNDQGASNRLITGLMSVTPGVIGLLWVPTVSTWSDRTRTGRGRRIPFLLVGVPAVAFILAAIGENGAISEALHRIAPDFVSIKTLRLATLSMLVVGYYFCNVLVYHLYFLLFNDVVPRDWMSRFAVLFRIVGTVAGSAFHFFLFPYARTCREQIFLGVGLLFAVAYLLMCLNVKEGSYPPPVPFDGRPGLRSVIQTYFRQCFGHRYYLFIYLTTGFDIVSDVVKPFILLMMSLSLGLNLTDIGRINGIAALSGMAGFIASGFLMERFDLLRLTLVLKVLQVVVTGGFVIYLFTGQPPGTAWAATLTFNVLVYLLTATRNVIGVPMNMMLFPRLQFGQISSAMHAVAGAMGIAGGFIAGASMDGILAMYGGNSQAYRWATVWLMFFGAVATLCLVPVYRHIRDTHGPDLKTFVPPDPASGAVPLA
ncbi:MAG: MFS transporter [Terrimicrobiaceae bacterium]|nr:MFS transporter [Terrimicrobiaceae bacterium]